MKGVSAAVAAILILISIIAIAGIAGFMYYAVTLRVPKVYDGEFGDVGLSASQLEDPFYSHFTINPVTWSDDEQSLAGNATLELNNGTTVPMARTYQADIYFEIKHGDVEALVLEYDADDTGVFNTSSIKLKEAAIYDYKTGTKIADIAIEDNEFTYTSGPMSSGDYVLRLVYETTKDITLSVSQKTTDSIGTLDGDLRTTGDRDEFNDFAITALIKV